MTLLTAFDASELLRNFRESFTLGAEVVASVHLAALSSAQEASQGADQYLMASAEHPCTFFENRKHESWHYQQALATCIKGVTSKAPRKVDR